MSKNKVSKKTYRRNRKILKRSQTDYLASIKIKSKKIIKAFFLYTTKTREIIHEYQKIVINRLILLRQYSDYYFEYYKFYAPKTLRYNFSKFQNKFGFITFNFFYFAILFIAIVALGSLINLSIDRNIATTFLFGEATMVGGALAIITSFSLFTLQNAAGHLPRGFYEIATDNKKYTIIFYCVATI